MKIISLKDWDRKEHFEFFSAFENPNYNICANIPIGSFLNFVKIHNLNFYYTFIYIVMKTIQTIPELRLRIDNDMIVEHEIVHPSFTTLNDKKIFSFCTVPYYSEYNQFIFETQKITENCKNSPIIKDDPLRSDRIYITTIPWVSFTSLSHPFMGDSKDSVPRIAWGKYFYDKSIEEIVIPFSIQVHHALVDGYPVGIFYQKLEEYLKDFSI